MSVLVDPVKSAEPPIRLSKELDIKLIAKPDEALVASGSF